MSEYEFDEEFWNDRYGVMTDELRGTTSNKILKIYSKVLGRHATYKEVFEFVSRFVDLEKFEEEAKRVLQGKGVDEDLVRYLNENTPLEWQWPSAGKWGKPRPDYVFAKIDNIVEEVKVGKGLKDLKDSYSVSFKYFSRTADYIKDLPPMIIDVLKECREMVDNERRSKERSAEALSNQVSSLDSLIENN